MLKFVLYTNVLSPHQLPLAHELVSLLGADNFRYIYTDDQDSDHASLKFDLASDVPVLRTNMSNILVHSEARDWLETADVVLSGLRDVALFERRAEKGLKTFYMSEPWKKSVNGIPWWVKWLVPSYRRRVLSLVDLAKTDENFRLFPIGVHAEKEWLDLGVPREKLILWGYFVAPSAERHEALGMKREACSERPLRVMWCGRRLKWKHPETVEMACTRVKRELGDDAVSLDMYSTLTLSQVREEMHRHDVLVLASDSTEGWGAVVSEALEEGMMVIGTNEAGASATLLPKEWRYPAGDSKALAAILSSISAGTMPSFQPVLDSFKKFGSAKAAAERLLELCNS